MNFLFWVAVAGALIALLAVMNVIDITLFWQKVCADDEEGKFSERDEAYERYKRSQQLRKK